MTWHFLQWLFLMLLRCDRFHQFIIHDWPCSLSQVHGGFDHCGLRRVVCIRPVVQNSAHSTLLVSQKSLFWLVSGVVSSMTFESLCSGSVVLNSDDDPGILYHYIPSLGSPGIGVFEPIHPPELLLRTALTSFRPFC